MALFVPMYQIPSVMSVGGNKMNIKLLKVEGVDLPSPPKKKQWAPVDVPAGKAIKLTAQITDGGHTSEVEFTPPALSEGKTYILAIDTPFLTKKKGMRVTNRRHFMNRGAGAVFGTFMEIFLIVGMPDAFVEVFRPQFIKSDAPKAGTSILLYERLDDGKKKNKISLKLIYQYSIWEMQGVLVP
ncbi:hypothetical protein FACS1894102_7100 [Spirochaetia bacterium]|nr:hypothetical protein FACS1894102_7100 [Spirochaetia bacterium]